MPYETHSNRCGLPHFSVQYRLSLTVDNVPANGVQNTLMVILAIAPDDMRYKMV